MDEGTKLILADEGFVYTANSIISITCAKNISREEIVYKYEIKTGEDRKRLGQIISSKNLPYEEDIKRDKSIKVILLVWAGLKEEEAEKVIAGLIDAFNELSPEELDKLRTIPEKRITSDTGKQQCSTAELYDCVGEAFEGISDFNQPVTCYNKGIIYEHKIPIQNRKSGALSYRTEYNIYCIKLSKHAKSNANYPIAVVTPGHVLLPGGEIELYLNTTMSSAFLDYMN